MFHVVDMSIMCFIVGLNCPCGEMFVFVLHALCMCVLVNDLDSRTSWSQDAGLSDTKGLLIICCSTAKEAKSYQRYSKYRFQRMTTLNINPSLKAIIEAN